MKILIASDQYFPTPGGISVVTHRIAKALTERGNKVAVIAPATSWNFYEETQEHFTVYRIQSILVHKLKQVRYSPTFLYKKEMEKIINNFMPDIVHLETPDAVANITLQIATKLHIPVIATCHIMPENISGALPLPSRVGNVIGNLYMKQLAQVFNKVDFVTAPTLTGISILKADGVKTPMQALSNGIDLKLFQKPNQSKTDEFRAKLHLPKVPLLLYVGRLDKEKCVDILVKSLQYIKKDVPFHLIIAGKGEQLELIQNLIQELHLESFITFLGFLKEEELPILYSIASVFVMPSTAELQSLVTMEAMALGLPVIGARAGALPYLIKPNINGFLFAPNNPKDLAQKLSQLLADNHLREQMGKESLRIIRQHDIQEIAKKLEDIYIKVIAAKKNIVYKKIPKHSFLPSFSKGLFANLFSEEKV